MIQNSGGRRLMFDKHNTVINDNESIIKCFNKMFFDLNLKTVEN